MAFMDQINADIKASMLAKEKEKLAVLRDIKSKLLLEATSGGSGEVTEEAAAKIILKLYKQRTDTYELYVKEGRDDLAQEEKFQAEVLKTYMPEMMSEEEIKAEAEAAIAATGASGPQDMGKVMGMLTGKLAGKADGKVIAATVKALLLN
ncbi:GatB/YqeY domain-containing protein [Crocinitomicaceae bacterium]|nr:GatB/YqeY domain-containing protein [Crocinitomicaceae bacterium]